MRQYKTVAAFAMLCVMFIFWGKIDVKATSAEGTNENISWKLEDGVLTIWGKGDMPECEHKKLQIYEGTIGCDENNADWIEYKEIESIVIKEGITSISSHAFFDLYNTKNISIPSTVKTIGHAAFSRSGFRQITIPDSVTSIGEGAFLGCSSLENVTLPKNITKIRKMTFDGCYSLKQVNIPKKVKTIGKRAFDGCYALKQITIPCKVKTIEENAFKGCEELEQVNMEKKSSLQKIGANAFSGCNIKKWTMPATVTEIGSAALGGVCKIQVEKNNKKYKSKNGVLFSKNGKTLVCYPEHGGKDVYKIPKGVKTIGSYAFADNVSLKKVIMPDSVIVVEQEAFFGAEKLKTVRFSKNLKRVEEHAFSCYLSSLKLPNSLEVIEKFAFDCDNIKGTIVVPKNVKEIGYHAFTNTHKVKKILIKSKKLKKIDKKMVFSTKKVTIILPKAKKESYEKFFTKKRQGKNIKFIYK